MIIKFINTFHKQRKDIFNVLLKDRNKWYLNEEETFILKYAKNDHNYWLFFKEKYQFNYFLWTKFYLSWNPLSNLDEKQLLDFATDLHAYCKKNTEKFKKIIQKFWYFVLHSYILTNIALSFRETDPDINYWTDTYIKFIKLEIAQYFFSECFKEALALKLVTQKDLKAMNTYIHKMYKVKIEPYYQPNSNLWIQFWKITEKKWMKWSIEDLIYYEQLQSPTVFFKESPYMYNDRKIRIFEYEEFYKQRIQELETNKATIISKLHWLLQSIEDTIKKWKTKYVHFYWENSQRKVIFNLLWLTDYSIWHLFTTKSVSCLWNINNINDSIEELKSFESVQNSFFSLTYEYIIEACKNIQFDEKRTLQKDVWWSFIFNRDRFHQTWFFFQNLYFHWWKTLVFDAIEVFTNSYKNEWKSLFKFLSLFSHKYELYNQYLKISLFVEYIKNLYMIWLKDINISRFIHEYFNQIFKEWFFKRTKTTYQKFHGMFVSVNENSQELLNNKTFIDFFWKQHCEDVLAFSKQYFELYLNKLQELCNLAEDIWKDLVTINYLEDEEVK